MSTHRPGGGEVLSHLHWIKSSRSGSGGGNCIEVAHLTDGDRAVRDSKNPTSPVLIFTSAEWIAFIFGVRSDEFNSR